jgi:hypothetical protein
MNGAAIQPGPVALEVAQRIQQATEALSEHCVPLATRRSKIRRILLFAQAKDEAGLFAFVLNQHTIFDVTKAASDKQLQALLPMLEWDLVIIPHIDAVKQTAARAALSKRVLPRQPVMILCWGNASQPPIVPDADIIAPHGATNADIIERVRVLSRRKRGPRPRKGKPVQSALIPHPEALLA